MKIEHMLLDPEAIASALQISVDDVLTNCKDGRVLAMPSELWVCDLYGFHSEPFSTNRSYDGWREDPQTGVLTLISVRTIGKSRVKFQQSTNRSGWVKEQRYGGRGKKALLNSLREIDVVFIVDIQDFPEIEIIPVSPEKLIYHIKRGNLDCIGWTREQMKGFLDVPQPWGTNEDLAPKVYSILSHKSNEKMLPNHKYLQHRQAKQRGESRVQIKSLVEAFQ